MNNRPKSATVNKIGKNVMNNFGTMTRENVLKSFSPEVLNKSWNALCQYVAQNYESGKGTSIKGLGVFTFTNAEVNLEGTTNQYSRDRKQRKPVFIVSKEFNENLRPGQFNPTSGLIYYNQKQNNSISHVKFNYAEIAYSLNITKDEAYMIITNLISYLADSIRSKQFSNKEMPGVGLMMLRGNVFGVKFNESLTNLAKNVPQKLLQTKKNMQLYMEPEENKQIIVKDLPDAGKAMKALRPKTAVITKISQGGEKWLKDNLDIDLNELDAPAGSGGFFEEEKVEADNAEANRDLNFINDKPKPKKKESELTLADLNIPHEILQAIEYHKTIVIANMKGFDKRNSGTIQNKECARAFSKANIHFGLTIQMINDIVKIYAKGIEYVDYLKLMTCLLRDIKNLIGSTTKASTRKKSNASLRPMSARDLSGKPGGQNLQNQTASLNSIQEEIKTIKLILDDLYFKYRTQINQLISLSELCRILRGYSIVYPQAKIKQILEFIDVDNTDSFSINEFVTKLKGCKIFNSEISQEDIIINLQKLKDIIYVSGGKKFLFGNSNSISLSNFINLFLGKTKFSLDILTSVYHYITKSSRDLTVNDYDKYFVNDQREMNEAFDIEVIGRINQIIQKSQLKSDEYFSHLLTYNVSRNNNTISRVDFHRICLIEKIKYNAEEIDHIFDMIDKKKDGVIDRQEFNQAVNRVYKPLYEIQDVIKRNKLDVEDLAYRMDIDPEKIEVLDYIGFKGKIKKLDYTYSDNFIQSLFTELSGGESYLDTKTILDAFNVFKKENFLKLNNDSFKKNFIENIKIVSDYDSLKKSFEYIDRNNNGRLTKADFCSIIQKYSTEFKDEDIMKFTRITGLIDNNNLVKYPEFLLLIFYDAKSDTFNLCIEELKKYLINSCKKDLNIFFQKLNHEENRSIYDINKTITIEQLYNFFKARIKNLDNNVVCKFDLDSDGLVSYDDIVGIFERYLSTSFFKFDNSMHDPQTNLYAYDTMSDEKFKSIVRELKKAMKKKNITEVGLFNKLDLNRDGFVSNYEFNSKIDEVLPLADAIKDQFFDHLDYYHNGLVDLNTFLKRFKEFKSNEVLIKNNNKLENEVIEALKNWIRENITTYSDTEIYALIDKDSDGVVSLDDFKAFCLSNLGFSKYDLNDYKLQRVLQSLSLTKNSNICMGDIKDFINKACDNKDYIDFKEKFKETINQNLYKGKENTEWINDVIEKFGMFISERYETIKDFFEENTVKNSGKFTLEDFERFHRKNYECFQGFNLTQDEILAIFTTLDSQKKNYLVLGDLENKLKIFDFYKKMHTDVKTFIQQNFNTSIDAFKFFINNANHNRDIIRNNFADVYITKKDFFDTLTKFFPNKYLTETILKYMRLNFKNIELIPYSEFNWVYFDKVNDDDTFVQNRNERTKLKATRQRPQSAGLSGRTLEQKLQTPYDYDALTKLRRIIDSSNIDYNKLFNMYKSMSNNGYINQYEFRNMIKSLGIGLTHLEIEEIISKIGKTRDGRINIDEFIKFATTKDNNLTSGNKNVEKFTSDIKELIYKYYSTPKLAFQFNDVDKSNTLDFNEYKSMVCELYTKESRPQPNFAMLKNSFDFLDLRKDGMIDMNEWNKAFSEYESKLDVSGSKKQMKVLREWESSNDVQKVYMEITRNRKLIKDSAKAFFISDNDSIKIQSDNLISVLKHLLPRTKLSMTQWKMLVKIGDKDRSGMIDYNLFMSMVEKSAKQITVQPRFK